MASFNTVMPFAAWTSGNLMIASHGAVLPPFCVKCGRPADPNSFCKKFSWHPQWIYIFVLLALLLYVIIALAMSKRMTLQIPLCARHLEKYKAAILPLGCVPEMILAGTHLPEAYMGFGIGAGILALHAAWCA
jgi:hypothetical protein